MSTFLVRQVKRSSTFDDRINSLTDSISRDRSHHDLFFQKKQTTRAATLRSVHIKKCLQLIFSPRTVALQLMTWICIYLLTAIPWLEKNMQTCGTSVDIRAVTMIISFCLIFSINQSFTRRERTLQDIAKFKSNLTTIYYALYQQKACRMYHELKNIIFALMTYMTDKSELRENRLQSIEQKDALQRFYNCTCRLFDIIQNNENITNAAFLSMQIQSLIETFERIVATKDYSTPLGIRSFSVMMVYGFPITLSPYFVWHEMPDRVTPYYGAYFWSYIYILLFGALLDVQKKLDDIFDGHAYQEDIQIHIDEILDMIHSPTEKAFCSGHLANQIQSVQPETTVQRQ